MSRMCLGNEPDLRRVWCPQDEFQVLDRRAFLDQLHEADYTRIQLK